MANWTPLREALAQVGDRVTFGWDELDDLVGGLPPSAYKHAAFWKGVRSRWLGFSTVDVHVGRSVIFVRRSIDTDGTQPETTEAIARRPSAAADVVLVGCVRTKLDRPAPAQDLYTSSLFRKARSYAEASGARWFVLSAKHGIVPPTTVLQPYDLQLSKTSRDYRRAWGRRVVEQLTRVVGPLAGSRIEIHAGAAYADAIRDRLIGAHARVLEPLRGLGMGQRLSWYSRSEVPLRTQLGTLTNAMTPTEFLASGGAGMRQPGLYSWWVDHTGAADLSVGLCQDIEPGLIYAGLAGATRTRSGRESSNTLWGRIRGIHLGGRHEFSTFRRSLGAILANARNEREIDEDRLTAWMHRHLRLIAVPVDDADALNDVETTVLAELNPPLNLAKMAPSPVRRQLTALRRKHGHTSR